MSKTSVALAATGVGGTGAAALAGAHYMGAFGGYGEDYVGDKKGQLLSYNGNCLNRTFGRKWTTARSISTISKENKPEIKFEGEGKTKGCLVYNWNKWKEGEVLKGNFRFV